MPRSCGGKVHIIVIGMIIGVWLRVVTVSSVKARVSYLKKQGS